ncbi:deubiquitinase OTUD6B [Condylostylus longicornis]|uniref:deubiquitinase OTUD6B n=1 Tax=Condylostylus longicornis TaxID=2530218 RepID=UPI00244DAFF6|nr:deubiquitinase OTUD6B [Condylostylus longicornis]
MSEGDDNENTITLRHRKEKKELQSKIQSLKKSASKGDKKKRKEILDEIAKIESDLAKRHSDELNTVNNAKNNQLSNNGELFDNTTNEQNCSNDINELENNDSNQETRISKAQRRRDKKAQREKAKEAELAAQEGQYKNGPRTTEMRALKDILKKRGLRLYSIPSDGDCLYNAICHQMSLAGLEVGPWECSGDLGIHQKDQIKYLRNETANYIEKHKETLIFYMTSQGTGDLMTDEEFQIYCNQIRDAPTWGGQIEIRAISNVLKVRIEVLQATGPPTIQECDEGTKDIGPTLVITYHRHMYSLGEHYNSTIPLEIDEEQEEYLDNDVP